MMRALLLAASLIAAGAVSAAQPVGRLFFAPTERAQLDIARATKRTPEPPASASQKAAEPPPPQTQTITYNGIVRRSDGKSILWLNSRAVDEKEALSGLPVSGRVRSDGAVTLQVPNSGGTIDLKVGQRAELQTGRVSEARPPEKEPAPEKSKAEAAKSGGETAKADAAKSDKDAPKDAKGAPAKSAESTGDRSPAAPPAKAGEVTDRRGDPASSKAAESDSRTTRPAVK